MKDVENSVTDKCLKILDTYAIYTRTAIHYFH